ncbi:MAG: TetR/AcrR family transcriptional regulator, partial [Candidatus Lindowbacteria bacterium]|nr:TetR/AcrR family transcriptional regulator [Candidatus Lindowbacteria bacterium]
MRSQQGQTDTRRRILQNASDLLERGGMNAVSLREVARLVGVTPMAIYNHFPSREALLVAVYEKGVARLARQIWRDVIRADSPARKLRAIVRAYVRFGIKNPYYYTMLFGSEFI